MSSKAEMDNALRLMKLEDVQDMYAGVDLFVRCGFMTKAEADKWYERIHAWAEFLRQ